MTNADTNSARDETCVRVLAFMADRDVSRTELTRDLFKGHLPAVDLDDALTVLEGRGLIAVETRPRETGAGTPTKIYRATQPRQTTIVDVPGQTQPDATAKPVAAVPGEPAALVEGRKLLGVLTRLKTERAQLNLELAIRRDEFNDALLDAELGDSEAIDRRDGFAEHEQRIGERLRAIEPVVVELTRRFRVDEAARRLERERLAYRAVDQVLPRRTGVAVRADTLIAELGSCIQTLRSSEGRAIATLQPHLQPDAQWNLSDAGQMARAVIGRVIVECGLDVHVLLELTGNGMQELARESTIATTVASQHRKLLSRRPAEPVDRADLTHGGVAA